jgi:hypothetical protein
VSFGTVHPECDLSVQSPPFPKPAILLDQSRRDTNA